MKAGLVIIPAPGRGHIAVAVELAKVINQGNRFSVTILTMASPVPGVPTLPDSYAASIAASGLDIHFLDLPTIDPQEKPAPVAFTGLISRYIASLVPHVKNALLRLQSSTRVVALVVDFFATTVIEAGDELGIPSYIFSPSSGNLLGFMLYLPTLDAKIESDFEDLEEDIEIPGLSPLPLLHLPASLTKKSSEGYKWFLELTRRFRYAEGIIVNTFRELEPAVLEAVSGGRCLPDHPTPPVFPVGPVVVLEERDPSHPCIAWLDSQPPGSVVFLCFGSMGTLPEPQVREIALGLERSGHRFLWSIRTRRSSDDFTVAPTEADLEGDLPEGFVERTKDRGLVWPRWAPQTVILSHEAIGGFVSHCGWNSTLESLWFGVPILPWPLRAEQRMNALELVRDIGAAVELIKMDYKGQSLVGAAEVERGVRRLMGETEEGRKARGKAVEARAAGRAAVEAGGSSSDALTRLTEHLLSHNQ
ncbi:hypothetical protein H6P81_020463 [Aristolochia fimbriata]|uniref:Glycosyltransferase n=1 Tax=Aristolochia fimbriata TaxID=158543 RepID=A0AAV7DYV3_ARIFI|nr:hypothetical protein H6P81_020463 [Aristolochia fimbriata]